MKVRRLMSFALSVFLTLIPINPNVAFAGVDSQGKQTFAKEVTERSFETLAEQGFPMSLSSDAEDEGELVASQDAQDKGELLAFLDAEDEGELHTSLATEDKGELSTSTSLEAEDKGELSTSTSLEAKDKGELSTPTSLEAENNEELSSLTSTAAEDEEFSKADPEDMLADGLTYYNTIVKGIQITSANKDDVLGDGGSVKYEPASGGQRARLILNNATINDDTNGIAASAINYSAIQTLDEMDLILNGKNDICVRSFDSSNTENLENLVGIVGGKNIYISGGGSLSIEVDSEEAPKKLWRTAGVWANTVYNVSFNGVKISVAVHGKTQRAFGILNCCDISDSDIEVFTDVAYNEKIVAAPESDRYVNGIRNENADKVFNIKSSKIDIHIEPGTGLAGGEASLRGIVNLSKSLNISGDTSISTKNTLIGIYTSGLNIKDRYKIDLEGSVVLAYNDTNGVGVENVGINFENISPGAYFIAKKGYKQGILFCSNKVPEGAAKFKIASKALVLAGASEETAVPVTKDELGNLIRYYINPSAPDNVGFIKIGYKRNISFNEGGGSGTVYDVQVIEGSKYTLPSCEFSAPYGMRFKAWEVGGVEYAPGTQIVISGNTEVTALWENRSSGGGGSSGGGSRGGSGGGGSRGGSGGGLGGGLGSGATGGAKTPGGQSGSWVQDATGWWYKNADGSYPRGTWQQIGSTWYAFNGSGYMITGWYSSGGSWYYLNTSGAMATGWAYINGYWYYFNASGAMATGWIQPDGYWYYLEQSGSWQPQGSMYASDYTPDGYFVNENGVCVD